MDQKELKIQRALGTIEYYWIKLWTHNREEPVNLDKLLGKVFPTVTRYVDGEESCFAVEAHSVSLIEEFVELLDVELKKVYKYMNIEVYRGVSENCPLVLRHRYGVG
ncbi:MAG: hypothetical protein ACTSV7_04520 [Candidatus Baldrarchaeia archaeon]